MGPDILPLPGIKFEVLPLDLDVQSFAESSVLLCHLDDSPIDGIVKCAEIHRALLAKEEVYHASLWGSRFDQLVVHGDSKMALAKSSFAFDHQNG